MQIELAGAGHERRARQFLAVGANMQTLRRGAERHRNPEGEAGAAKAEAGEIRPVPGRTPRRQKLAIFAGDGDGCVALRARGPADDVAALHTVDISAQAHMTRSVRLRFRNRKYLNKRLLSRGAFTVVSINLPC